MAGELTMAERADYLAELRFTGGIYESCALDERALREIVKVMHAISETAKELWRAEHPSRERMPEGFSESNRVRVRVIRPGSAVVLLDHSPLDGARSEALEDALVGAVSFMRDSFRAVCDGADAPPGLTPPLSERYSSLGSALEASAAMFLAPADGIEARVDREARRQLRARIPASYDGTVDLVGRARAVDAERGVFRLWLGPTAHEHADFSADDERLIASALQDRDETLLRVRGRGRYRITGELIHVDEVTQVDLLDLDLFERDPDAPTFFEITDRAFADVPPEVWESLPTDLAERHDDYFAEIGGSA